MKKIALLYIGNFQGNLISVIGFTKAVYRQQIAFFLMDLFCKTLKSESVL
jgi:hypothetical protein